MSTGDDEGLVADAMASDDCPFKRCDGCGEVIIEGHNGGHTCDHEQFIFEGRPRIEEREVMQGYDDNPPDSMVAYSRAYRAKAYHLAVKVDERLPDDDPEAYECVSSCMNRIRSDKEWDVERLEVVQSRYKRYPCTECHDLPIPEINERIRELRAERISGDGE